MEASRFFSICPVFGTRDRNKNPAAARFASAGLDFGLLLLISYPPPAGTLIV